MHRIWSSAAAGMLAIGMIGGCAGGGSNGGAANAGSDTYRGTLKGGAGIGGEHTGWVLDRIAISDLEVDVGAVQEQAEALRNQPVVITGEIVDRRYVERGVVRVLVADSIAEAP